MVLAMGCPQQWTRGVACGVKAAAGVTAQRCAQVYMVRRWRVNAVLRQMVVELLHRRSYGARGADPPPTPSPYAYR